MVKTGTRTLHNLSHGLWMSQLRLVIVVGKKIDDLQHQWIAESCCKCTWVKFFCNGPGLRGRHSLLPQNSPFSECRNQVVIQTLSDRYYTIEIT